MLRPSLAVLVLALAASAQGSSDLAYRLAGTWVSGQTLRALEAGGTPGAPGCHLSISAEPVGVVEVCRGWSRAWDGPLRLDEARGRIELEGTARGGGIRSAAHEGSGFGAEGRRLLVGRAGAPNELELRTAAGPRSPEGLQRLYRIDAAQADALQAWMERDEARPDEGTREVAPAVADRRAAPEEAPAEKVAIAEPIAPKPRLCGCGAAEGALGGAALWPALAWLRVRFSRTFAKPEASKRKRAMRAPRA